MKNLSIRYLLVTFFIISLSVVCIHAQGLKLYLSGSDSDPELNTSSPTGSYYEQTVQGGSSTITFGNYFLTNDIEGTDYTLNLICASKLTKDFTAIIKIGNKEVVNTTFSVSGAQYKIYNIPVSGFDPDIIDNAEVKLLLTLDGTGFGGKAGILYGNTFRNIGIPNPYILIPLINTQVYEDKDRILPHEFYLSQNYPNPFNPMTRISYSIPNSGFFTLKIYDVLGREIQTLVSEVQKADRYSINFQVVLIFINYRWEMTFGKQRKCC